MRTGTVGYEARRARRGMSMIEMIMVMAIIGVLATFALPKINVTRYQMDTAAQQVRGALQMAERLSVTRQYDVVVGFDVGRGMVRLLEDANNNGSADSDERVVWRAMENGARFAPPPAYIGGSGTGSLEGTRIEAVDGMPSIVFKRNGASSTDMEIYMTSGRGNPEDARAVVVVQATGRTDWYRYVGSKWKTGGL